jgi:hypothetical protein
LEVLEILLLLGSSSVHDHLVYPFIPGLHGQLFLKCQKLQEILIVIAGVKKQTNK